MASASVSYNLSEEGELGLENNVTMSYIICHACWMKGRRDCCGESWTGEFCEELEFRDLCFLCEQTLTEAGAPKMYVDGPMDSGGVVRRMQRNKYNEYWVPDTLWWIITKLAFSEHVISASCFALLFHLTGITITWEWFHYSSKFSEKGTVNNCPKSCS